MIRDLSWPSAWGLHETPLQFAVVSVTVLYLLVQGGGPCHAVFLHTNNLLCYCSCFDVVPARLQVMSRDCVLKNNVCCAGSPGGGSCDRARPAAPAERDGPADLGCRHHPCGAGPSAAAPTTRTAAGGPAARLVPSTWNLAAMAPYLTRDTFFGQESAVTYHGVQSECRVLAMLPQTLPSEASQASLCLLRRRGQCRHSATPTEDCQISVPNQRLLYRVSVLASLARIRGAAGADGRDAAAERQGQRPGVGAAAGVGGRGGPASQARLAGCAALHAQFVCCPTIELSAGYGRRRQ